MVKNSVGVYQEGTNGYWEYRFVMMVDGKQINKKKSTDAQGNKLKTKTDAIRAREAAMAAARTERTGKPKVIRRTVQEVFEEFCEKGTQRHGPIRPSASRTACGRTTFSARFGSRFCG